MVAIQVLRHRLERKSGHVIVDTTSDEKRSSIIKQKKVICNTMQVYCCKKYKILLLKISTLNPSIHLPGIIAALLQDFYHLSFTMNFPGKFFSILANRPINASKNRKKDEQQKRIIEDSATAKKYGTRC